MKLFLKAKGLFDSGRKEDPFDQIAMDLIDHVRNGNVDYIKTVNPNVLLRARDDKYGDTILMMATSMGNVNLCEEILKRCPSLLYQENNYKKTVLHQTTDPIISLGNFWFFYFFLSVGIDQLETSKNERDIYMKFKRWMKMQDLNGDTALVIAACNGYIRVVKRFLEVDLRYNLGLSKVVGDEFWTTLNWAVGYKDPEMVKLPTDVIVSSNNRTALQWAMHIEVHTMIKTLTGSGDPNRSGAEAATESNVFTLAEVSKHNNLKDCWLLINGKVYDVTKLLPDHPGGREVLLNASGKDATMDFEKAHSHSSNALTTMDKFYVGVCDSITSLLSNLANDKPQLYSQVRLKEFTKDFSQPLGSGSFGDVYKGRFPNGVFIAVKVLKNIEFKEKVMEEQFVAEVETMGRAHHRNLIKLYGYCYEANTKFKALVYDYIENGSLHTILFEKKLDIPWAKLHNIAKEIAQGISYLHESCSPQIIHQDIKPSNVLLDSNHSPIVIDFGLAKVNRGESQFEQTKVKGSRDYMAPEVNQPEKVKLSCKLDVYSFGKILFDILGSKRNHADKSRFPGLVWEKYKTKQLDKFILECGIKEDDKENAKRLAIIALLCVEHNPRARPMLSNVVKMLDGNMKQLDTPVAPFYPDYYPGESSSMSDSRDY